MVHHGLPLPAAGAPTQAHGSCFGLPSFPLRLATWNCRGLALTNSTDPVRYQDKLRYLQKMANTCDIIGMQEVHGNTAAMYEVFKALPS